MDRSIRRLGLFLMVLFCALFAQLNYLQFFGAEKLNTHEGNDRPVAEAFNRPRGTVMTADGVVLARSVPVDTKRKYLREFPEGATYAQITGYFNYNFGAAGLEQSYNDELSGTTARQQYKTITDLWEDRDRSGDLTLTVRSDLQEKANEALAGRKGSIVALDPTTGGVLALWSWPTYDPNLLSTHDDQAALDAKTLLDASQDKPLLARAYRETYAPGSTFKVITASAALKEGVVTTDSFFPATTQLDLPQTDRVLKNYGGHSCGNGDLNLIFAKSCNVPFAQMALDLGGPKMIDEAQAYGFNSKPPFDLPAAATSVFPNIDFSQRLPSLAQSGIGQFDVRATPLQMALVAAAVANDGTMPTPHVVDTVTDQDGKVIEKVDPGPWKRSIDPAIAADLRNAMVETTASGTVSKYLQIPGVVVGAKSGTAQIGDTGRSHAWVIAWATREGETTPFIAVAVLVEGSDRSDLTGGPTAGPPTRAMIEQALQPMPEPPAPEASTTTQPGISTPEGD